MAKRMIKGWCSKTLQQSDDSHQVEMVKNHEKMEIGYSNVRVSKEGKVLIRTPNR